MGLFDDLLEEDELTQQPVQPQSQSRKGGLFDDLLEEDDVAIATPQAAQPAVTQPSPYKYDPARFRPKGLVAPKAEQEIGTLEGISNAAKNAFDSSRQALDIVGDVTPEEAQNIAKIEFDKQSRKIAPGYDEYQKAEGFDAVLAFAKNPIEVTSNIVAEGLAGSLPALGAGLAAGGVGAAIGAPTVIGAPIGFTAGQVAGTFAGSLATEYGSKILEEMQEGGVDLTKPESIQGFFENEEAVAKARDKAISRGIPVAAFDAISAGIGGKLGRVIGKQFLTKTGEAAAELGVQAGLGGGGEVAGALVAGEPIEGKAVFGEIIGEAGPGAAEIITGRMADRAARVKAEEEKKIKAAAQLSDNLEQNSAPLTAAAVKSTTATTIEQDKLAAQLEEQLDADELVAVKEPTAAAPKPMSKDEFKAIYSQVAPEELDAAEAGFTNTLATAATEEARANAQNALEAIKEVKAIVTPPAPTVEPTITPAVTPAVPTAQPPITDATQEIIQPEGVRQEPQDGTQVRQTEEAGVGRSILGAARGQEEGQVVPTPTAEEPLAVQPTEAVKPAITEQEKSLGEAQSRYDSEIATYKNQRRINLIDDQELGKKLKAAGMRFAAEKRKITGQLTEKEAEAEAKREASNYIGKLVEVDGKPGKVVGNPFGRVRVKLDEGGATITAAPDKVTARLATTPEPIISEIPPTSELVGAEPAAIVEQEPVAPAEPQGTRVAAAAYIAPDGTEYAGPSHLAAMEQAKNEGKITQTEINAKQAPESRETPQFGYKTDAEPFVTRDQAEGIARQSGQLLVEKPATGQLHSNEVALDEFQKAPSPTAAPVPVTTPPVTEAVTPAAEQPAVSVPASGKPFEFFSIRNKEKAPRLGTQFGQDVEPSGKYISQSTPDAAKNLDARFEKKAVRFENPLVVEFGGEYGTATNWKNVLSSQYGGKTGKELSQAIRDAGYDGIVTVEPAKGPNRPASTSEIVDISSLKPKKQAAEPAPVAPAAEVAPVAGDVQPASEPKAQQAISATSEAISKKEPLPQTRGKGIQYHGARGPIESIVEGYYSSDNIYGGEDTFYTTDALEIAAGYQRKKQSGVIYRVDETAPVNFFNMEERKPKSEWLSMFEGMDEFFNFAVEGIPNDTPNLREIMDEMRAESANEGLSKDDVQEIFGSITYRLDKQGYGGMTHIGGLKTNREPHTVKIYFNPSKQISISLEDVTNLSQKPTTPAPTPAPAAAPTGITVGNRIKLGKSPQTYTIEEVIPQSATERELGEQYYSVKNEKTGEVQVVEKADMKQVGGKRVRKLFAGEKANIPQFMRDSLDTARAMAAAGKTSEEIRVLTGWFSGIDSKMRWEIPDQDVKLKDDWKNAKKVGDLIEHKKLFDAYPDIANIKFEFRPGFAAGVTEKSDLLVLPSGLKGLTVNETTLAGILHEIQHLIQYREGFERGGNESSIYKKEEAQIKAKKEKLEKERDEAKKNWDKTGNKKYLDEWKKAVDAVWDVMGEKPIKRPYEEEFSYYNRLAGEIESRDVEARMRLTPEQRKLTKPYSSQNISPDQIVLMNEMVSEPSLEETQLQPAIEPKESVTPIPEANRYTFEEAVKAVDAHFGKQGIPEGIVIVNNTTDPDLEMKAGYFVNRGQIVINLAYIAKGENLGDIIDHELGHYIFGDPEFQADFKQFWELMTPEEKADADRIISQFYNKETGAVQMEEKQIRAFMQLIQDSKAMPKWKQLLDKIKRWINEKLGTNFQVSDRGALAVLAAAHKRFKSGEQIVREIDSGVLKSAETAQDAEYLAAVERGDMETVQRMVDEAAKRAGYNVGPVPHGTTSGPFNEFRTPAYFGSGASMYAQADSEIVSWKGKRDTVSSIKPEEIEDELDTATGPRGFDFDELYAGKANGRFVSFGGDGIYRFDGLNEYGDFKYTLIENLTPIRDDSFNIVDVVKAPPQTEFPRIIKAYLKLENPAILGASEGSRLAKGKNGNWDQALYDRLVAAGNDGAIADDDWGGPWNKHYIAFSPNQIKSADPVTYDDAGDIIPLSQRFRPTSPDIRRMAAEPAPKRRKEQVGGAEREETRYITTPKGILSMNTDVLREKFFDGTSVSPDKTTQAWGYISRLLDIKSGNANELAGEINDTVDADLVAKREAAIAAGEKVDLEEDVSKRIGAAMFSVELMNYAGRLAEQGDTRMLKFMIRNVNSMPTDKYAGDISDAARALRTRLEYDVSGFSAYTTEQKAKVDRTAAVMFGTNKPSKEQSDAVKDAIDESEKTELGNAGEVAGEVEKVEKRTKRKITDKIEKVIGKGSLKGMIQAVKDTPLEKQQERGWIEKVVNDFLINAGLSPEAASTASKLYESLIAERFAAAKQKAFEDNLKKAAPWKNYAARNSRLAKDALNKVQAAIRTGVLDPEKNTESIIAAESGWSGFTKDQYQRIVQLDSIINDPKQDDVTRREAMADLNKVISDAKLPVRFKDALGAYYVGNALMGIPTLTVNIASPIGFTVRNLMTDVSKFAFTDPARIPVAFETFMESMRSWYDQTSYAFKNQIYLNDVVEYLQGQNVLRELFDKGKKQWSEGKYAEGFVNMAVGMTQITGRVLSSLDQGAISMLENQNITRYALEALANTKGKVPKDKLKEFANMVIDTRRKTIAENIANGMSRDRAGVLADLAVKSEVISALAQYDVNPMNVLDASINDALQSVGRNKTLTIKGIEQSQKNISDEGFMSYWPIKLLEMVSAGAGREGSSMQIFAKMLYGFALVPARVFHNVAWFSPYGFIRLGVDKYKKNKGEDSPYAMSLQTEAQYKQRLTDAIAGSVAMLGLAALSSASTDEDEDKKFKIVITGNGPSATTDKQYFDSWMKKWKPYSVHIVVNGNIIPINIGRGGEALFFPIMLAGALDDWRIKQKQNLTKKEPEDLSAIAQMLGSSFFALAQRGPYAAFTKPLFDASKDGRVTEELTSQAGFFGKTFIPVLGSSLARNISDLFNDPVDRSSIEGAIYANTPVVGPWLGTKALNALGQPIRADDWGDRLFKLGVPVVFSFPKETPMNELNELILKQGSGPTIPTRANAQKRFGDILTDKEFETYVREYGRVMSDKMFKSRTKLANMKPADYDDELEKYARGYSIDGIKIKGASDSAVLAVKRMRQ